MPSKHAEDHLASPIVDSSDEKRLLLLRLTKSSHRNPQNPQLTLLLSLHLLLGNAQRLQPQIQIVSQAWLRILQSYLWRVVLLEGCYGKLLFTVQNISLSLAVLSSQERVRAGGAIAASRGVQPSC